MNQSLEVKRWVRSLITTCAASVSVTESKRQSVGDFINFVFNNIPKVWYEFKGGKLVYFIDNCAFESEIANPDVDAINGKSYLDFDEHLTEKILDYVQFISCKWFSVPSGEINYDLTNKDIALQYLLVGNTLALLPWRHDNTFEIRMHGVQLLPGDYQVIVREMYVFDKTQYGAQGPYNAIGALVTYHLTITEGKISGHRKGGRRKPHNIKIEDRQINNSAVTKVKDKKKDRGISL